jgi:hypothetical protein
LLSYGESSALNKQRQAIQAVMGSEGLGGHPKAAINRHLKTGHFLRPVDRDVDRDEEFVLLRRHGKRLEHVDNSKSSRSAVWVAASPD